MHYLEHTCIFHKDHNIHKRKACKSDSQTNKNKCRDAAHFGISCHSKKNLIHYIIKKLLSRIFNINILTF